MKSSSGFSQFGGNTGFGVFGIASGFANNSSFYSPTREEWAEDMLASYQSLNGALSGPLQANLLARFEADYMWDTFGFAIGGQGKSVANFIYLLTIDGDITARGITKSGDIIRWDIDGTVYDQNNLPDHTLGVGDGVLTFSSTDIWSGITVFNISVNNFTGTCPEFVFANCTQFYVFENDFTGALNISNFTSLTEFRCEINANITSIANPVSSAIFTHYTADNCNLTGTLDISNLLLGGIFKVHLNTGLTSIINPVSSEIIVNYYAYGCNLTGNLDMSGLTGLGGQFLVNDNPLLTSISNPTSSEVFVTYYVYSCNLTGALDLSGLTGFGGGFLANSNPLLTSIINPESSEVLNTYIAHSCNLTGTLDVSGLTGLGGDFRVYLNPLLTGVNNPDSAEVFNMYWAYDCAIAYVDLTPLVNLTDVNDCDVRLQNNAMLVGKVNQILVELNSISNDAFTGRDIDISGTNAAPDAVSGGFNGLAAVASLILKNFTVTIT